MFQPCASSDGHIPSSSPLSWRREPSPFLPARGIFLKLIPAFGGHKFLLEIPLRTSSCTAQGSLPNKTLPQLSHSVFPLHEALFLQTATIPSWSIPDTELFVPFPFPCHQLLFRLSLHLPGLGSAFPWKITTFHAQITPSAAGEGWGLIAEPQPCWFLVFSSFFTVSGPSGTPLILKVAASWHTEHSQLNCPDP